MFTGRLTADAKVRNAKGDKQVTGFTLAINKRFKTNGEKKEKTAYIVCSYWRNATVAQHLKKGQLVTITGWLGSEAYTDKDGKLHSNITCSVDNIEMHGTTGKNSTASNGQASAKAKGNANSTDDDDLPF